MQLPDENIEYNYQRLLAQPPEAWTPLAELQTQHLISLDRLDSIKKAAMEIRGLVGAERELLNPPPKLRPLQAGFIDLPQKLLDQFKRKQDASDLGKIIRISNRLREDVDRIVVLGTGGSYLGPKALFDALCHSYHNEMPAKLRMGKPRMYFEGNSFDNDPLQDLFELLENTCVDPDLTDERWGIIVATKSDDTLETAATYRAVKMEAAKFYGQKSPMLKRVIVPITGAKSKLRDLCKAEGYSDEDILNIPEEVGARYGVFTPVGLLPAATLGLDIRAMLLGAATMTRRFLEEPFDRNPVLQYAAVNYLMSEELKKPTRVTAAWSRKLESVGWWYDELLSESLSKSGRGPTPFTVVNTRDLHSRGQQHQDGMRDKMINNLLVRTFAHPSVMIGMADRNEDDLNQFSRKGLPDLVDAAHKAMTESYSDVARPTADILLPALTEHTIGQLLQMLMLATVVEGRLMGLNPYGQPGVEVFKANMTKHLKAIPNLPKGEKADAAK
ncbi:MAG: glucose-6-phosphate isomerase [Planctomycetes bacterium]|nr:glucose-6-phosphate isomerase [Planctomycetota bacterium]